MRELRVDLFSGDVVIFAPDRSSRPTDMAKIKDEKELTNIYEENCPFCRGNESYADKKTFELKDEYGWVCRSIYNKYPIIDNNCKGINGSHEVMIENYRHNGTFYNMTEKEFNNMFLMYKNRYINYIKDKEILYVSIFKNFLKKAGASLAHPHSQIVSMNIVPKEIKNELSVLKNYYDENNESLYDKVIKEEIILNERVIFNGEKFIAIVPYASMYGNEVRVICKDNTRFEDLEESNLKELSYIFHNLFKNIYKTCGYMPFNLSMHSHPKNIDCNNLFNLHFHIIPRKYSFGGFEISNGMYVSSTMPKDFTKELIFK